LCNFFCMYCNFFLAFYRKYGKIKAVSAAHSCAQNRSSSPWLPSVQHTASYGIRRSRQGQFGHKFPSLILDTPQTKYLTQRGNVCEYLLIPDAFLIIITGEESMTKKALQWHPAFQAALQIEFMDEPCQLEFLKEFNLTEKPLQIDTLVIKPEPDKILSKSIGHIFRKYNIIEYKNPEDYFSINDYYRVRLHLPVQHRKKTGNSSGGAYHLTGCQPLSQEAGCIFKGSLSCRHLSKISGDLLCDGTHVPDAASDSPQAFQRRVHLAEPSSDEPEPSGGYRTAGQSLCRERKEPALRGGHGFYCTCKLKKI